MFCPNCGQQQVSDEMRFCSRCGIALSGLAEWLTGGMLPAKTTEDKPVPGTSPRRKGMRRAGKVMFVSGVLFPVILVFSLLIDEGAPMVLPIAVFFVALVMMLYARLFMDNNASTTPGIKDSAAHTSALGTNATRASLPPPSISAIVRPQVKTNELAEPPSVTEHTTKLLE